MDGCESHTPGSRCCQRARLDNLGPTTRYALQQDFVGSSCARWLCKHGDDGIQYVSATDVVCTDATGMHSE